MGLAIKNFDLMQDAYLSFFPFSFNFCLFIFSNEIKSNNWVFDEFYLK